MKYTSKIPNKVLLYIMYKLTWLLPLFARQVTFPESNKHVHGYTYYDHVNKMGPSCKNHHTEKD